MPARETNITCIAQVTFKLVNNARDRWFTTGGLNSRNLRSRSILCLTKTGWTIGLSQVSSELSQIVALTSIEDACVQ